MFCLYRVQNLPVPKQLRELKNKMLQETLPFTKPAEELNNDGKKRKWLYPKIIKGKLYRYRSVISYVFLTILFVSPFLKLNGEQLVLLNVLERKFVLFGIIFWPQDFYLFVLAFISFIVFVVLFTVVFGRVFCGWVCPQTIFLEMVFRKIENWIEGDGLKQKRLDEAPFTLEKLGKKTLKHGLFLLISFLIANIFLSYIIGSGLLLKIITEPVSRHWSGFISICVFTVVFYLVFSRMRELVCTVACPYGRLQGVLLDNQSIIVAYDYQRGEPRGKKSKEEISLTGDCIDCKLCVQVCPTGIDIRKGTQMECVNCTACIDACDMVMEKINRPVRLIGFKSEDEIASKGSFQLNRRIYGYAAVLLVLLSTLTYLLIRRSTVEATILRAAGTLYQLREKDHTVSNLYNTELVNKTNDELNFEIVTDRKNARIQYIQQENRIEGGKSVKLTFFVILPQQDIQTYKSDIGFSLISEGHEIEHFTTTFIATPND
jgi:cytochrome c oxidase accessory protein FixG